MKFVLDALNKVAYQDDGQVSVLSTAKLYTEGPARVLVQIRRLGERDLLFGDHFGLAEARSGVSEGVIQPAQQQQQEQAQAPTTIRS